MQPLVAQTPSFFTTDRDICHNHIRAEGLFIFAMLLEEQSFSFQEYVGTIAVTYQMHHPDALLCK